MERGKLIEILIAMIFVVLVFIMIIIGISVENSKQTSNTITNSYNKVNLENNYNSVPKTNERVIYRTYVPKYEVKRVCTRSNYDNYEVLNYHGEKYQVYVYNQGPSKYFTVRFYFKDYWGDVKSYDMRKYVFSGEEERFYFYDIHRDPKEYFGWRYQILN